MPRPNTFHLSRRMSTLAAAVTAALCLAPPGSSAAGNGRYALHIPSQSLQTAINQLSEQADWQISYPAELVEGLTSPPVSGQYSAREALDKLLSGSGLIAVKTPNGAVTVVKAEARPEAKAGKAEAALLTPMTVTGSAEYDETDPYNPDYNRPNATTATKTDTPVMETPVSIQVIPKAILADKQITTLPDAVNGQVSGVLGRTGGGYLYDNFIIRGLAGSGFGDAYRNGLFNRQDIYDIANIERIDILKGPAAVLYGRIEPGGLVNYVTKKPLDTAYYSIQQQFGSYDQYRTLMDATGPIDRDRTLLYRINGSYTNNQSFRDFVGNERFFVAPAITWRPTDRFETNLELEYKHDRIASDFGIPAIDGRPAPIPITRSLEDGFQRETMESTLVGFDWTYRFNDDWKVTQRYLFKDWTLSGPTLYNYGGVRSEQGTVFLDRFASKGVQDVMTHSGNLDLNGKFELFGSRHSLLIGVDGFLATTEAHDASGTAPFSIDIFNPVYGQIDFDALTQENSFFYRKESWLGAYVQDQITFFDRLHLLLGGRYDNVTTGANFTTASLDAAKAGRVAQKDDAFSPRTGLLFQALDWLSLYGNYSKSFSGNNGVSADGAKFDPQRGKQYEIGIKVETPDKRLSSTLALFHLTKTNLLTDDPNEADPNFQILAGAIRSRGIEFDLAGQITDRLHLLTTYAYTEAKYTQDFNGLLGNRLENVPRHQGSVWGTWQFNQAFKAGLGAVAVGRRWGDADNTFILPGYVRLDAMAAYTHTLGRHKFTAQLNVNNLLDKEYYTNSDGSNTGAVPGVPINVFGSLKYEF